ncbi:hypothetical protein HanHA300_Chr16g0627601 [Helianthus annuus]|nr:hypothetical protein HanHA300_Chr16g0627601 [Helianthus annuus]KAJ0462035.1 hypothetical protein HanHA89_Chr16g0678941 [Helianthus annuus]KAJ0642429.1 hypothetical protein HanLR1_Chr16g0638151 [Helianthus annuus]
MSIGMKQLAVFWGLIEVANRQFQLIYMKLVLSYSTNAVKKHRLQKGNPRNPVPPHPTTSSASSLFSLSTTATSTRRRPSLQFRFR